MIIYFYDKLIKFKYNEYKISFHMRVVMTWKLISSLMDVIFFIPNHQSIGYSYFENIHTYTHTLFFSCVHACVRGYV